MHSRRNTSFLRAGIGVLVAVLALGGLPTYAATERKPVKPGFNLFSKQQDIAMGQEAAVEIEKEVQIVNDRELTAYIEKIGKKLAQHSQDPEYPFTFKLVADPAINAFALPGGPIYIHTGLITSADNEAQVAGVMGHEIGHVVLRHSTNQASKATMFQLPAMLAAGILDQKGGMLSALGQLGLGLGLNSALLSYSRKAEHDADIVGARMLSAAGYSPVEMATFFQKLEEAGGGGGPQFMSSHPNPGNRVEYVTAEITGYRNSTDYITNTREFPAMKARAAKIQPSKKAAAAPPTGGGQTADGASRVVDGVYKGDGYSFRMPSSWQARPSQQDPGMAALPSNGVVGEGIARGILVGFSDADGANLQRATDSLVKTLTSTNKGLAAMDGQRQGVRIDGATGESLFLEGPSPINGEREYVWLVTALHPNKKLFYMAMISPTGEYNELRGRFEEAVRSLQLK